MTGVSRPAMLGGVSGSAKHEAEGDAAGAVPAPPAIDFPAESSDPKYDGEEHGVRRPSPPPPRSAFILGAGRWLRGSAQDLDKLGWIRAGTGPAVQCRGRAGRLD